MIPGQAIPRYRRCGRPAALDLGRSRGERDRVAGVLRRLGPDRR
ncbi:hypothetical protein [Actinoplanes sp. NPDC049599]